MLIARQEEMSMIVRKAVCATALSALVLTGASETRAAEHEHVLNLAHVLTTDQPAAKAAEMMAEVVAEKTDGSVEINILPAGQLGDDTEIVEQIQFDSIQMGFPPTAKLGNFEPRMQLLDLPFIFPDEEDVRAVLDGDIGQELMAGLEDQLLKGLCYWGSGYKQITSQNPILSPDDLAGVKMRTMDSPLIIEQYRSWGANPVPISFAETYNALQQGVAEAQENSLVTIDKMKFYEVQNHLTLTRHAYLPYAVVVSLAAWNRLSEDQQSALSEACDVARDWVREELARQDIEIAERLANEIEIHELSEEAREQFVDLSQEVHTGFESVLTRDLLDRVYAVTAGN